MRRPASRAALGFALAAAVAPLGQAGALDGVARAGTAKTAGPRDLNALRRSGVLRAIVLADEAPETFALDPAVAAPGFERELLEGFAQAHGLRLVALPAAGPAERLTWLLAGRGDLVAAIFDTEERRRQVDFTSEVLPERSVAVALAPRRPPRSEAELRGLRLAALTDTEPAVTAAALTPRALLVPSMAALIEALRDGAADAAVLPFSEFAAEARRLPALQAGVAVGPRRSVAWAVRKSDRALREALDAYLALARRTVWSRLLVKYFGTRAPELLAR